MILIADSGSTKTEWRLISKDGEVQAVATAGINPNYQTTEAILADLQATLLPTLSSTVVTEIYFYGAGCSTDAKCSVVAVALQEVFPGSSVHVMSDVVGAARGACGHEPGIACILGTGSNSCYFDGEKIAAQMPCLGFTLGNEGSGSYMGKQLLSLYLNNELPVALQESFKTAYPQTQAEILQHVYNEPFPNRYIASFATFIADYRHHPFIKNLVTHSFLDFFKLTVCKYQNYQQVPTHFVGSIAFFFADFLKEVAQSKNILVGQILRNPIDGLLNYHQEKRAKETVF